MNILFRKVGAAADSLAGSALGLMCGDALGAPVEGLFHAELGVRKGWISAMLSDGRFAAGSTTDDSQLMTGILEALKADDRLPPGLLARRFADNFESHRGYGASTQAALQALRVGRAGPEGLSRPSYGNGGAMGIAPLGVYFHHDLPLALERAENACRTTHHHPEALAGAVAVAACAAILTRCRLDGVRPEMEAVLEELQALPPLKGSPMAGPLARLAGMNGLSRPEPAKRAAWLAETFETTLRAVESVPVSLGAALSAATFREAVEVAVNAGGDTDTQGAMAGGLAGACFGTKAIPTVWMAALENGPKGRDYVRKLALRLGGRMGRKAGTKRQKNRQRGRR
ncbi:MAG: ADP-ribosylglycohydrolase family protein [bacterium]